MAVFPASFPIDFICETADLAFEFFGIARYCRRPVSSWGSDSLARPPLGAKVRLKTDGVNCPRLVQFGSICLGK